MEDNSHLIADAASGFDGLYSEGPADAIKVKGAAPVSLRFCRECGHPFHPARHEQVFCPGSKCRMAFNARRAKRAIALYDFAMNWRSKRLKGGFTQFCQMIDEWLRADRTHREDHVKIRRDFEAQQRGAR
jgi:hypothetical protein